MEGHDLFILNMTVILPAAEGTSASNSSGISVIIVGLGMAGLSAAIECHRRGHTVVGLEKAPKPTHPGDIFSIGRNGAHVIQQWDDGAVARQLDVVRCDIDSITVYDETGTVREKKEMDGFRVGEGWVINRSDTVGALYNYAQKLGVDLRFGVAVRSYWEDEHQAGVEIGDHERLVADCVIASDGIHSKARAVIVGGDEKTRLRKTGSAIFRCGYPASLLQDCPEAQWLLQGTETHDQLNHFIGKDITMLMGTGRHGKDVYWGCMHKSFHDVSEPWLQVSDASKALEYIENWPCKAKLEAVIQQTPQGKCFDHLVLAADPLPRWTSSQGRMILIGDAAHPFLPTTGQGANQALEDAAVVAICLELAGKSRVALGLLVMEKLRHQRVSLIQDGGLKLLQTLHKADWNSESKEEIPTMVARPTWIFAHDCLASTYEEFNKAADAILTGTEYIPTNIPSDGQFRIVDEESKSP
ncbi:FAD-dependent monooxygenase roqM [Penicillium rolfsii]|nr:FAD-dependent monooxygenase roqM [Penicillium rolfsii]